jgi:hypothetical protein
MKKFYFFIISSLLMTTTIFAQDTFAPVSISQGTYLGESIPLRDFERVGVSNGELMIVPINGGQTISPKGNVNNATNNGDPLYQNNNPSRDPNDILLSYDAIDALQCNCTPADPTGAAGPNHYVHAVNMAVIIYDKAGNIVVPAVSLGNFFGNGVNNGDPIVMYDQFDDRWFISQFIVSTDEVIIAISTTSDPTGTYDIYEFPFTGFPDYPHYGVTPDAYYLSVNQIGGNSERAYALERDVMIAGGPNPQIVGFALPGNVSNPFSIQGHMPVTISGSSAPAGVPGYIMNLQDDYWSGVSYDHIKIWEINVDWVTIGNSTISAPAEIAMADFESRFFAFGVGDIKQPNTTQKIDANGGTLDYAPKLRSFAGHNSLVFSTTVDINGLNDAGVRWVELRNVGTGAFSLYQEGTWAFDDGESRFFGNAAMDADGNIALAYSLGSENTFVGLYFTGRMDGDPLGQMSFEEQEIISGSFQTFSNRYNDYTQMSVDPDGETFWFTSTYFKFINRWQSRITSFNLDGLPILGDSDVSNVISYDVYPINDSYHEIKLLTQSLEDDVLFQVTDINGREVTNGALELTSTGNRGTFSTANLSTGVYMIRVYNNNFQQTKKIAIK